MSDHRDVLKGQKDAITNFVAWLKQCTADLSPAAELHRDANAVIERFLATQHIGPRHVPHCTHCGSDDVAAVDFRDRPLRELETRDPDEQGPAWECVCGAWTARTETP